MLGCGAEVRVRRTGFKGKIKSYKSLCLLTKPGQRSGNGCGVARAWGCWTTSSGVHIFSRL